mmetsp:Transcript_624/g.2417  ORF Transcript_624/g.2417 Transcript_624/m.2417 type:complete len:213 (+) Transcript_624:575-1213(+)
MRPLPSGKGRRALNCRPAHPALATALRSLRLASTTRAAQNSSSFAGTSRKCAVNAVFPARTPCVRVCPPPTISIACTALRSSAFGRFKSSFQDSTTFCAATMRAWPASSASIGRALPVRRDERWSARRSSSCNDANAVRVESYAAASAVVALRRRACSSSRVSKLEVLVDASPAPRWPLRRVLDHGAARSPFPDAASRRWRSMTSRVLRQRR